MRKLAYILLFSLPLCGQESNKPDFTGTIINSFIEEANKRDWHPEFPIKGIYFLPIEDFKRYIGTRNDHRAACVAQYPNYLMGRYEPMILVDAFYLDNHQTAKAFIFHELGHIFGQDHGEGLMSARINGSFLTDANLDLLFENIKNTDTINFYKQIPFNQ